MGHVQHYDKDGNKTPSVSEIPGIFAHDMLGFEQWICSRTHPGSVERCCVAARNKFYKESANLGHDIHNLREAFLKGESFSEGVPEYQAAVFEPIARFYKESGYKPLFVEEKMTGAKFGGTLDGIGTFQVPFWESERKTFWQGGQFADLPTTESLWVEDLKIKSKLDILHPLQLYGYSLLLKETKGLDVKYGLIIRREKNLEKRPEIQKRGYYLPDYQEQWDASFLMWKFLND